MGRRTLPAAPAGSGVPRGAERNPAGPAQSGTKPTTLADRLAAVRLMPACRRHLAPTATTRSACWSSPGFLIAQLAPRARRAVLASRAVLRSRSSPASPSGCPRSPAPARAGARRRPRRAGRSRRATRRADPGVAAALRRAVRRQPGCHLDDALRARRDLVARPRGVRAGGRSRPSGASDASVPHGAMHGRSGRLDARRPQRRPRRADRRSACLASSARPRRLRGRQQSCSDSRFARVRTSGAGATPGARSRSRRAQASPRVRSRCRYPGRAEAADRLGSRPAAA